MQREEAGAASITVDAPGFHGSLEELVARANRGDLDLNALSVSAVVDEARTALESPERQGDLRAVADALTLLARLVALKAAAVLPDQDTTAIEPEEDESTDAGRRLAEYRLFKAAAEALLAEAATGGARSFLGLVSTEVIPVERLRIAPERLAAAFRAVLERLSDTEPLPVAITYSVEDKVRLLRDRLLRGPLEFEDVFAGVQSRLEAVACFLALLEMLKRGEATVEQRDAFGPITVTGRG
ncbi:MAG: segregation and condensation protein A [Candidatus Dormibacteria bacterium]